MVNEFVKVEYYGQNGDGQPVRYEIANATAVSKGELLALIDPRTVSHAHAFSSVLAGVAAEEHLPNVGTTSISVLTQGVFEAKTSAAMVLGDLWGAFGTDNSIGSVASGATTLSMAFVGGRILETADAAETINVRLNL